MKLTIITIFYLLSLPSFAQNDRPVNLAVTGNFNFTTHGFGTNDAGLGLGLNASFFPGHKLQLLAEANAESFFGSKEFIINPQGRENKAPVIYSIKAGPKFFISKNIALSVTYGPYLHSIEAAGFTNNFGFKFGITGFSGKKKRFVTKLFMTEIPKDYDIQYFGFGVGYRFY